MMAFIFESYASENNVIVHSKTLKLVPQSVVREGSLKYLIETEAIVVAPLHYHYFWILFPIKQYPHRIQCTTWTDV